MEINSSLQLGLEQALKALVPYLQSLNDATWDFLDVFPEAFLFMAGHAAEQLPDEKTDFLAFIAALPKHLDYMQRLARVGLRMELGTGGVADENTRAAAIALHSQRTGAIIQLFSRPYLTRLRVILNDPARDWKALGFVGWANSEFADGRSNSGNSLIAKPSFTFTLFLTGL